jgi:hypothetical protein
MSEKRHEVRTESDERTAAEFEEARSDILSSAPGDKHVDNDSDAKRIDVTEDDRGVTRIDVRDDAPIKP